MSARYEGESVERGPNKGRKCCMPGCEQHELCGVGPLDEPMCEKHFNEWLAASRRATDAAMGMLRGLFGGAK